MKKTAFAAILLAAGIAVAQPADDMVRGCLSGSSGNYTFMDKSGKSWKLSGNTDALNTYVGHTIEIKGMSDSAMADTYKVDSVTNVSDSCEYNNTTSMNTTTTGAATDNNAMTDAEKSGPKPAGSPADQANLEKDGKHMPTADNTQRAAHSDKRESPSRADSLSQLPGTAAGISDQDAAAAKAAADASNTQAAVTTTDTTNAQPTASEPVATEAQTAQVEPGTAPVADSAAPADSSAAVPAETTTTTTDAAAADTTAVASNNLDSNSTTAVAETTPAETQVAAADTTAAPAAVDADQTADTNTVAENRSEELPQTASPLPLLGLLGFGSLLGGLFARRK